jgi:dihydroorotate dehydrogenase
MILRDIDFGHVLCASGARNFFGEGYWYSGLVNWNGSTFVAKTTTLKRRLGPGVLGGGNMPLDYFTLDPMEIRPACIKVYPWKGITLNAVGLSGPGAKDLLCRGAWQQFTEPFLISFMSVADKIDERLDEMRGFVDLISEHRHVFQGQFGLEVNFSCPNVGLHQEEIIKEAQTALDILGALNVPLVPKFNLLIEPAAAADIIAHPQCDALCLTNTIPWGQLSRYINWHKLFGTDVSPLAHLGGGGLSGPPLLLIVGAWIHEFRSRHDDHTPINGGGGVFSKKDALFLLKMGATAVFLGTVAMYRPWRVQRIIRAVNNYCSKRDRKESVAILQKEEVR